MLSIKFVRLNLNRKPQTGQLLDCVRAHFILSQIKLFTFILGTSYLYVESPGIDKTHTRVAVFDFQVIVQLSTPYNASVLPNRLNTIKSDHLRVSGNNNNNRKTVANANAFRFIQK